MQKIHAGIDHLVSAAKKDIASEKTPENIVPLLSEQEIIANWDCSTDCMVSVCMLTYNHEKYIRDAIEGVLTQKTDFSIELLIHDDASTDNTAQIIREYAEKYPNIIKPILQQENQYSTGVNPSVTFNYPRAMGRFIAICEGDDFWSDNQKLALQVAAMQRQPAIGISFHPAIRIDYTVDEHPESLMGVYGKCDGIIPFRHVIHRIYGWIPTASTVITQEVKIKLLEFMRKYPFVTIGDIYLQFFGAANSGALYINRTMSVYRYATEYSWTRRVIQKKQGKEQHEISVLKSYIALSQICGPKNTESIKLLIIQRIFWLFSNIDQTHSHSLPHETLFFRNIYDQLVKTVFRETDFINQRNERIIIYGAGQGCKLIMQQINPDLVKSIIDRDKLKAGDYLHGKPIKTIDQITGSDKEKILISIFTQGNQTIEKIKQQLLHRDNEFICLDKQLLNTLDLPNLQSLIEVDLYKATKLPTQKNKNPPKETL